MRHRRKSGSPNASTQPRRLPSQATRSCMSTSRLCLHTVPSALCFRSGRETLPHTSPRPTRPAKTPMSSIEQRNTDTTMAHIVTKSENKPSHNQRRNTPVCLIEQGKAPSRTERSGKAGRGGAPNKAARAHAHNRAAKGRQGVSRRQAESRLSTR